MGRRKYIHWFVKMLSLKLKRFCVFVWGWYHVQIDILKRLQREAFSEIMKLRDRQEKVERMISSKGGSFQETSSTHVRGEVDVLGAVLMMGSTRRVLVDWTEKEWDLVCFLGSFSKRGLVRRIGLWLSSLLDTEGKGIMFRGTSCL